MKFFHRLWRQTAENFPKILGMSQQPWDVAETKILAGLSHVTGPAELNEMVQYILNCLA
jgi:hypothetical protein